MPDPAHHPIAVAPKGEQRSILWHGILVFFATGGLSIAAAQKAGFAGGYAPSAAISAPYLLTVVFMGTLLLVMALKTVKKPALFQALFTFAMLSGAWFIADIYFRPEIALVAGSAAILLRFLWKSVLTANLTLVIGIAGIAASIAADISPNAIIILLAVLSFYDIVAVYRTRHMVKMFRALTSRGVVLAFVLPPLRLRELVARPNGDAPGRGMLLGTGDVAVPSMLAAAALRVGVIPAVASLAGASAGFALMYMLFLAQTKRAPMPALPPIALGATVGYLLSILIVTP
ncbi:MAG: presenilin family intramembrane aspartyl protease [Patescibacteria group bacterium]